MEEFEFRAGEIEDNAIEGEERENQVLSVYCKTVQL